MVEEHLGWFSECINLEEVDHDDVKVRLFSQTLSGEARIWHKNLVDDSIMSYQSFEDAFKDKWEDQKNLKQYLSQYHSIRRKESESIQEFSDRFMKVHNSIPAQFKPPIGSTQLQYAESFNGEFSLWLSERRLTSLEAMIKDIIEVEVNLITARKKKRDEGEWRREE